MKYEAPEKLTEKQILDRLSKQNITTEERLRTIVSAIYYGKTIEFSGDLLIKEFSTATNNDKFWIKNLFETFYDMNRTNYRLSDSIKLLLEYKEKKPDLRAQIDEIILNLREYSIIYGLGSGPIDPA